MMASYKYAVNRWALPSAPALEAFARGHVLQAVDMQAGGPCSVVRWTSQRGVRCVVVIEFVRMDGHCFITLSALPRASGLGPIGRKHSVALLDLEDGVDRWMDALERAFELGEEVEFPLAPDGTVDIGVLLAEKDPDRRIELAHYLRYRSGPDAIGALERLLDDASPAVRLQAAISLAELQGHPGCRVAITKLLDDPSIAVRIIARRILAGHIGWPKPGS